MESYLSGYRIMWILVMFDLPTVTKEEQKRANEFRNSLLELGFQMTQYSVYIRACAGQEKMRVYSKYIEEALPQQGNVQIFCITDRQYSSSLHFIGKKKQKITKTEQLLLFE